MEEKRNPNLSAQYFGFVSIKENGKIIVKKIEPNSLADQSGIGPEDEIVKINGKEIEGELNNILKKDISQIDFTVKKKFSEQVITLSVGNHYKLLEFSKKDNASEDQLFLRNAWLS